MVSAGLSPREAVRRVEARLAAAGCPDADYDARELFRVAAGRDARLSDRVLTTEEAEKLEALCTRREQREPLQYLCHLIIIGMNNRCRIGRQAFCGHCNCIWISIQSNQSSFAMQLFCNLTSMTSSANCTIYINTLRLNL